jgi:hypothetical protein
MVTGTGEVPCTKSSQSVGFQADYSTECTFTVLSRCLHVIQKPQKVQNGGREA